MTNQVSEKDLKRLIKESVKEVMEAKFRELRALSLSDISEEEQKDIEERHGKPSRKGSSESKIKV